jgi:hypothetical protein
LGQDSVFNANSISNTVELSGDDVWVENLIRGDDEQYYEDEVMGIIISQTPAMNQNTRVNDQ